MRKLILEIIELAIYEFAQGQQINLESKRARKDLASLILGRLSSRVFITEYKSQESFE